MSNGAHNPEFVGDETKFKYLAIHGYERWQVDKGGKLRDGKTSEWVKDYCRKDSDPDYSRLTFYQRYVLDGLRRLTGLHGGWPHNDPTWVSRALCAGPKDRPHVPHALRTLTAHGLLSLSNERLGSLEGREGTEGLDNNQSVQADFIETSEPKAKTTPTGLSATAISLKKAWDKVSDTPGDASHFEELLRAYKEDEIRLMLKWIVETSDHWRDTINTSEEFLSEFHTIRGDFRKYAATLKARSAKTPRGVVQMPPAVVKPVPFADGELDADELAYVNGDDSDEEEQAAIEKRLAEEGDGLDYVEPAVVLDDDADDGLGSKPEPIVVAPTPVRVIQQAVLVEVKKPARVDYSERKHCQCEKNSPFCTTCYAKSYEKDFGL